MNRSHTEQVKDEVGYALVMRLNLEKGPRVAKLILIFTRRCVLGLGLHVACNNKCRPPAQN